MLSQITVGDLMSRDVVSVSPSAKLTEAVQLMKEFGIRHLPVVENGRLVGIVSRGDIREAKPSDVTSLSVWEINYLWEQLHVRDVMTKTVITVEPDQHLIHTLRLMMARRFGSLPVVQDGKLVGIITEIDIFTKFASLIEAELVRAE